LERHSPPTRLTFISHAATLAQRRAAFPLEESLDESEIAKIISLGWNAPKAQQILSGPEERTQQTATALGLLFTTTEELRDCDYGIWKGRELVEVQSSEPDKVLAWLTDTAAKPHGGESILELIDRVGRWLTAQRGVGHILAVTHPAIIRAAIVSVLDAPAQAFWRIDIAPLSVTDLRFNGRAWTLRSSSCGLRSLDSLESPSL
jgi:broad specificity phosphatase PhoE